MVDFYIFSASTSSATVGERGILRQAQEPYRQGPGLAGEGEDEGGDGGQHAEEGEPHGGGAGDLDLYGQRDKIFLIRENEHGEREYHQLNINDAEIFNSPYYYLQQNDIVYVEPKKSHTMYEIFTNYTAMWFSILSVVTTLSTFILALKK